MTMKVIVAGGSGLVGSELLRVLVAEPKITKIISLTRRPLGNTSAKIVEEVVDFENLPSEIFKDAGAIFCCLGTTIKKAGSKAAFEKVDFEYPLNMALKAKKAGVNNYLLVSSMGANINSGIFYSKVKGKIEKAISDSGIPNVAIFRPSLLLGDRKEFRLGEKISAVLMTFFNPIIPKKYRGIHVNTVANAMLKTLLSGKKGINIFESDQIQLLTTT
ncbi:MAG: oxidoreductase [Cytophagaceae bacterium]|nr:oxidoreductase [Cytophagaceae bacterium]